MKAGDKITYQKPIPNSFDGRKWSYIHAPFEGKVLAIVDGYAMIRRPHCLPFVERVRDLQKWMNHSTVAVTEKPDAS